MTDTSTEAIAALMAGVTPGPWFPNRPPYHAGMIEVSGPSLTCRGFTIATDVDEEKAASIKSDARFIAAARELVPALSAESDALRAEVERLRATTPEVMALVEAATALRNQIARWHEGGPAAGPEESRALFKALDDALTAWEAAQK